MQSWMKLAAVFAGLGVVGWAAWDYTHPAAETNPIVATGEDTVVVLPFSDLRSFNDLPLGWVHDQFWMVKTMLLAREEKQGKQAMRCETNGSGSILSRTTDIELGDYPILVWDWYIDFPLSSPIDEDTPEGDDHPARLMLSLEDRQGESYAFELVWSNRKFEPGDIYKINGFSHYVVNGLDENAKIWQHQELDLMPVYRAITGRDDYPILKRIAVMCDSDNTSARSVAYFSDVALHRR